MNAYGSSSAKFMAALSDSSVAVAGCAVMNTSSPKEAWNALNVEAVMIMAAAVLVSSMAITFVFQIG